MPTTLTPLPRAARRPHPLPTRTVALATLLAALMSATLPALAAPDASVASTFVNPASTAPLATALGAAGAASAANPGIAQVSAQSTAQGSTQGDAVLHLLQDRGLLPSTAAQIAARVEANPLVQQVRDTASELVMSAMNFLGVRYRRGGTSIDQGFDCSGFTRYVFEHSLGLVLPRRADEQARQAGFASITQAELKPGDLVFFNTMRRTFSHVGIYVGEGKFIHAPRPGGEVRIEDMRQAYWTKRFNGARRAALPGGLDMQVKAGG